MADNITGQFSHVVMAVLSSRGFSSQFDRALGFRLASVWHDLRDAYGSCNSYYATTHPEIGNYFQLTTGQVISNDPTYTTTVTADNVVREVLAAGLDWRAYNEARPSQGYAGADNTTVGYVRRQDPLSYFSDVLDGGTQQNKLVAASDWHTDVKAGELREFSFLTPSIYNNGYAGDLAAAEDWLVRTIGPYVDGPQFKRTNGLLILCFDQSISSDTVGGGGQTMCLICSPACNRYFISYTEYGPEALLRLALRAIGVTAFPGAAATAPDMNEFFKGAKPHSAQTGLPERGVAALIPSHHRPDSATLSNPLVDVVALREKWSLYQPTDGTHYDTTLDTAIQDCITAGKKFSIEMEFGVNFPSWYSGATFGPDGIGNTYPVPWDTTYLSNIQTVISHLGGLYASSPLLVSVRLTGINSSSGELDLGHANAADCTAWVAAGFTPNQLNSTWDTIGGYWRTAFPNVPVYVMAHPVGMPNIDNNGHFPAGGPYASTALVTALLDRGAANWGAKFGIMSNALSTFFVWSQIISRASQSPRGYAMLWFVTGDTDTTPLSGGSPGQVQGYRMNNHYVGDLTTILTNAMNNGVNPGVGQFQEIYQPDVNNATFASAIAMARGNILAVP
jgi:acid phosphatase